MPEPLPPPSSESSCPCGSGTRFADCCGPILSGAHAPETAEKLMRARFTAHVAQDWGFLNRTYLETARQGAAAEDGPGTPIGWTRLVVHAHELGAQPNQAFVDFSAHYDDRGVERSLDEKAEFKRIDGRWIYSRPVRQGPAPRKAAAPKPGRNDPCPCGSGKKYKHCCGR